jgi:hypothetical protein
MTYATIALLVVGWALAAVTSADAHTPSAWLRRLASTLGLCGAYIAARVLMAGKDKNDLVTVLVQVSKVCVLGLLPLCLIFEAHKIARVNRAQFLDLALNCNVVAGLDEGVLLLSLPNSWLYGESPCKTNGGDE